MRPLLLISDGLMKRLSNKQQQRHARFLQKRWQDTIARRKKQESGVSNPRVLRVGKRPELKFEPPSDFSFERNYFNTVSFLREFKRAVSNQHSGKIKDIIFVDMEKIERLSLTGALVLAAEMDRWRKVGGKSRKDGGRLSAKNLTAWNREVRWLLQSIGFFDLLNVKLTKKETMKENTESPHVTVLPMISSGEISSGRKVDQEKLDQELLTDMRERLDKISSRWKLDSQQLVKIRHLLYASLIEATYNVALHAYPDNHDYEFEPVIKGWWATAGWFPKEECVKFIVYDQGIGIPATLPLSSIWEGIIDRLKIVFGDNFRIAMNESSNLIEAALDYERTIRGGGHGKGLQDIVRVVKNVPKASVRILSGSGKILYDNDERIKQKRDESLHIGGTLIEWTIPVTVVKETENGTNDN